MISYYIDTNYFLRLLLKDNSEQVNIVYKLFQHGMNHQVVLVTTHIVFFEVYWVLNSVYEQQKEPIISLLNKLLDLYYIHIDGRDDLYKCLEIFENHNISIEDAYHAAYMQLRRITEIATFDKKLSNVVKKLT